MWWAVCRGLVLPKCMICIIFLCKAARVVDSGNVVVLVWTALCCDSGPFKSRRQAAAKLTLVPHCDCNKTFIAHRCSARFRNCQLLLYTVSDTLQVNAHHQHHHFAPKPPPPPAFLPPAAFAGLARLMFVSDADHGSFGLTLLNFLMS